MANLEQRTAEPKKPSTERVAKWRKNNPDKYKEQKQRYDNSEKGREGRIRRYQENIEEARRRAREGMRRFREKQNQQQPIDIFPSQE